MPLDISPAGIVSGIKTVRGSVVTVSASTIDLSAGKHFVKTITTTTAFTLSNVSKKVSVLAFTLDIIDGTKGTITWWDGIKWEQGIAPTFHDERTTLRFYSVDGGETWIGSKIVSSAGRGPYWIAALGSAGTLEGVRDYGYGIDVDSLGNVYVTGDTRIINNDVKAVLIKYSPSGVLLWQRLIGDGRETTTNWGMKVDSSDNIYVTAMTTYQGAGGHDSIIVKYNSAGEIQWQRIFGGASSDYFRSITVDSSNNVYLTGITQSEGVGSSDFITVKYNSSGTLQWQRLLGGNSSDQGYGIAVDTSGNVYVNGSTDSQGVGNRDVLLAKYNSSGTLQWQRTFGGSGDEDAYGVATDSSGNVYLVGSTTSAGEGAADMLIVKYNSSGTLQWQRTLGNSVFNSFYWIAVDSSNNIYVSGVQSTSDGVTIAKYNSSGTLQWQRVFESNDSIYIENTNNIAVDANGNLYLVAYKFNADSITIAGGMIMMKLPADGNFLGTYEVNGTYLTIKESTLTAGTPTLTSGVATLTEQAASLTAATSTFTDRPAYLPTTTTVISL